MSYSKITETETATTMNAMNTEETAINSFASLYIAFNSAPPTAPCEPPCVPRGMMGRSWWKNLGYASACGCAYEADKKEKSKPVVVYEPDVEDDLCNECHLVPSTWEGKGGYYCEPCFKKIEECLLCFDERATKEIGGEWYCDQCAEDINYGNTIKYQVRSVNQEGENILNNHDGEWDFDTRDDAETFYEYCIQDHQENTDIDRIDDPAEELFDEIILTMTENDDHYTILKTHNFKVENHRKRVEWREIEIEDYEKQIPSYEEIIKRMENTISTHKDYQIRGSVFNWMNEFSPINYERMKVCMMALYKIPYDYYEEDYDMTEATTQLLKANGNLIAKEGGLPAQQACYYTMTNYMDIHDDKRLRGLQVAWSGCGEWQY